MNISLIRWNWNTLLIYKYKISGKNLFIIIYFLGKNGNSWKRNNPGRNQTRFPIPPGHLVYAIRHPMPDNDITFRGFSVGISPIIYRHKVEWPYPVVISGHGVGSTRPRDHLWNGTEPSVVTFSLILYTFLLPSLFLGLSREGGQFLSNQTSSSSFFVQLDSTISRCALENYPARNRVKREISS